MWAVIILFFLADKAFADGIETMDCEKRAFMVCSDARGRTEFPGSEADLLSVCPHIIKHTECLNQHDEVCATKEEDIRSFQPGQFAKIRDLLEDICNNNSLLHKVLTENLACIKESVHETDAVCTPKRSLFRKTYVAQHDIDDESATHGDLLRFQCLMTIQMMSCITGHISQKCGDMTKSAVLEILFRTDGLKTDFCPVEPLSDLLDTINDLELPAQQKEELQDFIASYTAWNSERK